MDVSAFPVPARPDVRPDVRRPFAYDLHAMLAELGIDPGAASVGVPRFVCSAGPDVRLPGDADEDPARTSVGRVRVFIDRHAGEALSLGRLAGEAHLSKYHFARVFQEATGLSPWAYVLEARIRRAKALLEEEDLPLSQVALEAGFCDQSHLTKAFKKAEGTTPGQYRKNVQAGE